MMFDHYNRQHFDRNHQNDKDEAKKITSRKPRIHPNVKIATKQKQNEVSHSLKQKVNPKKRKQKTMKKQTAKQNVQKNMHQIKQHNTNKIKQNQRNK